jgi:Domain of unknown function (DUF4349)
MDEDHASPGKGTIATILGVIAVIAFVGLVFLGGQVSSILSNVGNALPGVDIGSGVGGRTSAGDTTGGDTAEPEADTSTDGQVAGAAATAPELLIIRNGRLEIEVRDLDVALGAATSRVVAVGGFVSSSEQTAGGPDATATVAFRVPAGRWDDALAAVKGLATATRSLQVDTEAVTNQVIDLGARITNLRATEAAFQHIMATATKIPDVLTVQAELTKVRGEIEQLVAEKAHLEDQAAFGTLTVVFGLPATPVVEEVKAGWDPAADADAAAGTLIKIGQRATSFGIWVAIVGLPLLVGVIVLLTFALVARRLYGRGRARPSEA